MNMSVDAASRPSPSFKVEVSGGQIDIDMAIKYLSRDASAEVAKDLKNAIAAQPNVPQAAKEKAYEAIDAAMSTGMIDTPQEVSALFATIMENLSKWSKEMVEEAKGEADVKAGGAGGGGGGGGNWLVALAKALSKVAGEHLKKMVGAAHEIGKLSHTDTAGLEGKELDAAKDKNAANAMKMTQLTAEMQAHSQMYKLVQEATTTSIKTIGEALHSTARKQ